MTARKIHKEARDPKYDESHVEIILRVWQFFEKEKNTQKCIDLQSCGAVSCGGRGKSQQFFVYQDR